MKNSVLKNVLELQYERYQIEYLSWIQTQDIKALLILKTLDKLICTLSELLLNINSVIVFLFFFLLLFATAGLKVVKHGIRSLLLCSPFTGWHWSLATLAYSKGFTLALQFN